MGGLGQLKDKAIGREKIIWTNCETLTNRYGIIDTDMDTDMDTDIFLCCYKNNIPVEISINTLFPVFIRIEKPTSHV